MTARPLDQILPQRFAVLWIRARGLTFPRMRRFLEDVRAGWLRIAPWLAGLGLVFAYLFVAAWLDRQDAIADFEIANKAIRVLQRENAQLRAVDAERVSQGTRTLFYVIEGDSVEHAASKLQRLALTMAGDAFDMGHPAKEPHK